MGPVLVKTVTPEAESGAPRLKFLGPIMFEAGQERELRYEITEIDAPFQVIGLAIPGDPKMASFAVSDIRRNAASQLQSQNPIPALVFHEEAAGVHLGIDALRYGDSVSVVVSNVSDTPALFVCVLYGITESNVPPGDRNLPMGPGALTVAFGPAAISADSAAAFEVELKNDFAPAMLIVPAALGKHFEIVQLELGGRSQLSAPAPGSRLDEHQRQRDANLGLPAALSFRGGVARGEKIRLVVKNKSAAQETFSGILLGTGSPPDR